MRKAIKVIASLVLVLASFAMIIFNYWNTGIGITLFGVLCIIFGAMLNSRNHKEIPYSDNNTPSEIKIENQKIHEKP